MNRDVTPIDSPIFILAADWESMPRRTASSRKDPNPPYPHTLSQPHVCQWSVTANISTANCTPILERLLSSIT